MALQEALAKIEEYNAAMQLPRAGLLGIGAFLATPRARKVAEEELSVCLELCRFAELCLSDDINAARQNIHLYSALQRVFVTAGERDEFRTLLTETRQVAECLIRALHGETVPDLPNVARLEDLANKMHRLSEKIKKAIPRDAYLASLTGKTHPGLDRRQF